MDREQLVTVRTGAEGFFIHMDLREGPRESWKALRSIGSIHWKATVDVYLDLSFEPWSNYDLWECLDHIAKCFRIHGIRVQVEIGRPLLPLGWALEYRNVGPYTGIDEWEIRDCYSQGPGSSDLQQ